MFVRLPLVALALSLLTLVACSGTDAGTTVTKDAQGDAGRTEIGPRRPVTTSTDAGGAPDAALSCEPTAGQPLTTPWIAPRVRANACSTTQIAFLASYVTSDENDTAMNQAYQTFVNAPANDTCLSCIFTDVNASPRGAFVHNDKGEWPNYGGCFAAVSSNLTTAGCGARYDALWDCEDTYCSQCENGDPYNSCAARADEQACAPQAAAAECTTALSDQCFGYANETNVAYVTRFLTIFCGQ